MEHERAARFGGGRYLSCRDRARRKALAPDLPLLIPGVGAQGGDAAATVKAGYKAVKGKTVAPIVVNSSRAILYASSGADFAAAARKVAMQTRDVRQAARKRKRQPMIEIAKPISTE